MALVSPDQTRLCGFRPRAGWNSAWGFVDRPVRQESIRLRAKASGRRAARQPASHSLQRPSPHGRTAEEPQKTDTRLSRKRQLRRGDGVNVV